FARGGDSDEPPERRGGPGLRCKLVERLRGAVHPPLKAPKLVDVKARPGTRERGDLAGAPLARALAYRRQHRRMLEGVPRDRLRQLMTRGERFAESYEPVRGDGRVVEQRLRGARSLSAAD